MERSLENICNALCLIHLKAHARVRGTSLFYFTNNTTTYWVLTTGSSKHPHLHVIVEEIWLLEIELQCALIIIHIPGVIMTQKGSDHLSRGK